MAHTQTATARIDDVSTEIVKQVAEVEGVNPAELTPPLYEVIDPEALERIFASTPAAGGTESRVRFSYNGYQVTVSGDEQVSVQ